MTNITVQNHKTFSEQVRPDYNSASNKLLIYTVVATAAILGTAAAASASLAGKAVVLLGVTVALANTPHIVAILALLVVGISVKAIGNSLTQEYEEARNLLLSGETQKTVLRESLNTKWIDRFK